jgi:hypothetical protein
MIPNTKKLSDHKRTTWDRHCLLVLQFPNSLQAEIRSSDRFAEVTRGVRQGLDFFSPQVALDFFRHPSTIALSLGFAPSGKHFGSDGISPHANSVLSV